jgi:MFS family permease
MVAAVLGSSIVFLDGTIVNVALPAIGQSLPHSIFSVLEGQTYVTSGYLATLAALLILAGALSDFYGRRRVFAIGLAGFGLTSILCGLSPSLELLVVFRVLQGAAGALLVPCSLSIITATFEGPARGRAFGIWAAATSATSILGPDDRRVADPGDQLAGRVPDQRAAGRPGPVRDDHLRRREPRRGRDRPLRLARARSSSRWPWAGWPSGRSAARPSSGTIRSRSPP